ncbi:hypothetical protein CBR_g16066 [Chara braunii]|uniref:DUF4283 domain-containing protein n=1 Tax=Chara braunii TaxID=69332 RepID=A0A388JT06_CHABU|nr:hypothetical protein CBR_g16066 [Chara braunii]|eukprot:GBG60944.1 hypothetical protein CBR_g16066 [Chara braunii]
MEVEGGQQGHQPLSPSHDVGMVGAEEEPGNNGQKTPRGEEVEGGQQNRSPPPAVTNYWAEEERVREMLAKCFDAGIMPTGWDIGEMREEGSKAHFTLNPSLDEIKVNWLKERTVTVIFLEGSKNLPKKIKEDVIRAYEDVWLGEGRFDPSVTRGRVCIESSNVLSYIAKDQKVADWMKTEQGTTVELRRRWYSVAFKPWMTKADILEAKKMDANMYFWIRCLNVPIDAYCFLEDAATRAIGPVRKVYPPEKDVLKPQLINVRMDIAIEVLPRCKETLTFTTFQGQILEVKVVNASTPWCSNCKKFFHLADQCPRFRSRQPSRLPTPVPSPAPSPTRSGGSRHSPNSQGSRRMSEGNNSTRDEDMEGNRCRPISPEPSQASSTSSSRASSGRSRPKRGSYDGCLKPRSRTLSEEKGGQQQRNMGWGGTTRLNPIYGFRDWSNQPSGSGGSRTPVQERSGSQLGGVLGHQQLPKPTGREGGDNRADSSSKMASPTLSRASDKETQGPGGPGGPAGTPTKLRRRLSEDMKDLRIREKEEDEGSEASETSAQGEKPVDRTVELKITKRNRRQMIAKTGQDQGWTKYLLPLLFTTAQEGVFVLAWSTSPTEVILPSLQIPGPPMPLEIVSMSRHLFGNEIAIRCRQTGIVHN